MLSENFQLKKLKEHGINIKTKYIVGNKILERNSDNSVNDDIKCGIMCSKEYYKDGILKHKENLFDSRIEYTYIFSEESNKDYTCSNCGSTSKVKEFNFGCPYCHTPYNIEFIDKDLGSKYYYDLVLSSNIYRIITVFIDFIISLIICYFFIKNTSRTFNIVDKSKIVVYASILSLILYYVFYLADAYLILLPIRWYKESQNNKQKIFWKNFDYDKKTFFNNLNYEIRKYYFEKDKIIDYDVIDYLGFKSYEENNELFVSAIVYARIVEYDKKIKSRNIKQEFVMKKINKDKLNIKSGINIIKCNNCGASIDATKGYCEYCHTNVGHLQDWIIANPEN